MTGISIIDAKSFAPMRSFVRRNAAKALLVTRLRLFFKDPANLKLRSPSLSSGRRMNNSSTWPTTIRVESSQPPAVVVMPWPSTFLDPHSLRASRNLTRLNFVSNKQHSKILTRAHQVMGLAKKLQVRRRMIASHGKWFNVINLQIFSLGTTSP